MRASSAKPFRSAAAAFAAALVASCARPQPLDVVECAKFVALLEELGYETGAIERVPQRW